MRPVNLQNILQNAKTYLLEVGVKRLGPAVLASLVSSGMAFLAAHQGLLDSWGISFGQWPNCWNPADPPTGYVILIDLDILSKFALASIVALFFGAGALAAHHGAQAINAVAGAGAEAPPEQKSA